ncbi:MAG TPA: cytochrome c peroxidase [Myxococcota bacterium]|nr:cytochrome c peroxidase [Myxococcota bacterium]
MSWRRALALLALLLTAPAAPKPSAREVASLGKELFFDPGLSASHTLSCASCHDPSHAYGPPNALPAQLGGPDARAQGQRAVPSLRYVQRVPLFAEHYFDEDADESVDNGPTGGLTWDGRARNPHEQAKLPLLSPLEMANADEAAVVRAVAKSSYAAEFQRVFGAAILESPSAAFDALTRALEAYQDVPAEFFPYTSKYDAYLRQATELTAQEKRGLALFEAPTKGNCARCHPSGIGSSGGFPAFTDFGYAALAVPRNRALAANRDPKYYDLGLCGPLRTDLAGRADLCGMFRTPSLRNVTLRRTFFHNGAFHSLADALHFYVERELHPEKWYPSGAYDDLPPQYRANVNREPPFDRKPGQAPALDDAEIADVIAFLGTLTDGWKPPAAAAATR